MLASIHRTQRERPGIATRSGPARALAMSSFWSLLAIACSAPSRCDHDGGRGVTELEYSAHPDAEAALRRVAEQVAADLPVHGLAAVHRTGLLQVGDVAVVVAASAAHRGQAFEAARRLIDDLKATVPVWKRQVFADGTDEWVDCA